MIRSLGCHNRTNRKRSGEFVRALLFFFDLAHKIFQKIWICQRHPRQKAGLVEPPNARLHSHNECKTRQEWECSGLAVARHLEREINLVFVSNQVIPLDSYFKLFTRLRLIAHKKDWSCLHGLEIAAPSSRLHADSFHLGQEAWIRTRLNFRKGLLRDFRKVPFQMIGPLP